MPQYDVKLDNDTYVLLKKSKSKAAMGDLTALSYHQARVPVYSIYWFDHSYNCNALIRLQRSDGLPKSKMTDLAVVPDDEVPSNEVSHFILDVDISPFLQAGRS